MYLPVEYITYFPYVCYIRKKIYEMNWREGFGPDTPPLVAVTHTWQREAPAP